MRSLLQDKYSEDHSNTVKQREKSTALFNEVVRLGEEMEKSTEQLQGLNLDLTNRLQVLETKLYSAEGTYVNAEKRTDSNVRFFNEVTEKLEGQIHELERQLHHIVSDSRIEKDNTNAQT